MTLKKSKNKDKFKEFNRYELKAKKYLQENKFLKNHSKNIIPFYLKSAYTKYNSLISKNINSSMNVLEIGCGTGEHTEKILKTGCKFTASDISENSLKIVNLKYKKKYQNLKILSADIEQLPFKDMSFDAVCCAGSLSYGSKKQVLSEIFRVLKTNGVFISIDSLNDNPIYKLNRYIHFLRGNRSFSTLINMPSLSLLKLYKKKFGDLEIYFFGNFFWCIPAMKLFCSKRRINNIMKLCDKYIRLNLLAFRFVMIVRKAK